MKKWLTLLAALVSTFAAFADEQRVNDVDITVTLIRNGNAVIHEKWDVETGDQITEWYLPRENLGDIKITDFCVYSDNERLTDDGEWDVDRSRSQKAGKFGIVHKYDGVELCWGIGEYGHHVFEPLYVMRNTVKSLNDYDMLHLQLVNDELKAPPRHVKVTIKVAGDDADIQLDTTNCRIWGFGFNGTSAFEDGHVVFESSEPFGYYSSVIALLRFNKGIFSSSSIQERDFQEVLDRAMEGADFGPRGEEEDDTAAGIAAFVTMFLMYLFGRKVVRKATGKVSKRDKRKILGMNPNAVGWSREIPFDGDLVAADYTLTRLGEDRKKNALASAEILRMIYTGVMDVRKDADGKIEITFSDKSSEHIDSVGKDLKSMMVEASGEDAVLQDKEFSAWSKKNTRRLYNWTSKIRLMGESTLRNKNWMAGTRYTTSGQQEARGLLGFRKFLEDFTLTGERETIEAHLWQEYLVFGALLGVADKVAKQLKDIDPVLFEQTMVYDYSTLNTVIYMTNNLSRAITNAASSGAPVSSYSGSSSSGSWGGFGGGTSFGGGGGFSGGGHGGGGR